MTREMEIKILMEDRCTKSEAEKHLKNGTVVFDDFEENLDSYIKEFSDEDIIGFDEKKYRKKVKKKKPLSDWGVVEKDGKTYYIMYVL